MEVRSDKNKHVQWIAQPVWNALHHFGTRTANKDRELAIDVLVNDDPRAHHPAIKDLEGSVCVCTTPETQGERR